MDKFLIRKDVYEDLIEKGYGKRDLSKLQKVQITDKNGHTRTVYVRNGEQPAQMKQPKAQEGLTPEKKARYEEMLEKVKAGSDENALFVRGKGMLNKKEAIAHLEGKLGKKSGGNIGQRMANAEDKAFAESEKDAQKKYGNMSIEELKAEAKKYDGVSKYSPEANEARKVYDILNQKLEEEKKNNSTKTKKEKVDNSKAAENKKEIDRLMKIGFDRRSAYAKVALDEITERLDSEKDADVRKMLFDDMRDIQMNGLNAKYFEKHKEDYGF